MGENQMINLFEQAIDNNELLQFAVGSNKYFLLDREYGEHWVLGSWTKYIVPLINDKGTEYVDKFIAIMFNEIIITNVINLQVKNELLLYHLHVYYYLKSEGKIQTDALISLNIKIKACLNEYITSLKESDNPKSESFTNAINLIISRGGLQ